MFIEELVDSYAKYYRKKNKLDKLEDKIKRKLDEINRPIFIKDLIVRTILSSPYGEAKNPKEKYNQIGRNERLLDHINLLFRLVNEEHRQENYEADDKGTLVLKAGKENFITRLAAHEFYFYTSLPISATTFSLLLKKIEAMATQLEPNVHVLLASFAVINSNGKLVNLTLYVEGGNPPKLHSYAKNTASEADINYDDPEKIHSQQLVNEKPSHHAFFVASDNKADSLINNGSIFEVKTLGGACYTQVIDVCIDHLTGHSKELLERKLRDNESPNELIPAQVEQLVTSNTVVLVKDSKIAHCVIHADPGCSMLNFYQAKKGEAALQKNQLNEFKDEKYESLTIIPSAEGYKIYYPAFGPHSCIEVLATRPASYFIPEIEEAVIYHNEKACMAFEERAGMQTRKDRAFNILRKTNFLEAYVLSFTEAILNECRPNALQKHLNTKEYDTKLAATHIIRQAFNDLLPSLNEKNNANKIFLIRPWANNLINSLSELNDLKLKDSFIKKLSNKIEDFLGNKLSQALEIEVDKSGYEPPKID